MCIYIYIYTHTLTSVIVCIKYKPHIDLFSLMHATCRAYPTFLNLLKTKRVCVILGLSPYRAVNALHLGYKNQFFSVLYGKICCLFRDPYKTHKSHVITM